MGLSEKFVRTQLNYWKPLLENLSLDSIRKGQDRIGKLMYSLHRNEVAIRRHDFPDFPAAWVLTRDKRRQGVILYLHGGGYTCGNLDYALGFGSTLAVQCGSRVFCIGYRLAPEQPFPAALEDAVTAYQYLIKKGYAPQQITLCGESAGGGLCYALCQKLLQLGQPLPGGIIAISPWADLTGSGASYTENVQKDPSLTPQILDFYASCYATDLRDPLVSPLFGDLSKMPPSLLFAGSDELLVDDARRLHKKLLENGRKSKLVVAPDRWHGYVLYNLNENREDFATINQFLNQHIGPEKKLRWLKLDNAAKIYPASRNNNWSNIFRLSATLKEPVDIEVLSSALDITARRFPSICARLRKGLFWYYLEQLPEAPGISQEGSFPLMPMSRRDVRNCALRVIVYGKRIAVEFFHSLTDGTGGMVFLKTLLAEYLQQKYGTPIHAGDGILGRLEEPTPEELEDSFPKYAGPYGASRRESNAFRLSGTPEPDGYRNLTCFHLDTQQALDAAHAQGVSLTSFLTAAMLQAILDLQRLKVPHRQFRKPVKVQVPVNLRALFPSKSLRNFALYTNPEVNPRLGDYTFSEICKLVHHHMGMNVTAKQMSTQIAANVQSEYSPFVRLMPLFLKNIALKIAFLVVGERKICLSLSNLGNVKLPPEMAKHIDRMDFILAPQASAPHNCGVLSYDGKLYINLIRNIRESELEAHFYQVLRQQGLQVLVESNGKE